MKLAVLVPKENFQPWVLSGIGFDQWLKGILQWAHDSDMPVVFDSIKSGHAVEMMGLSRNWDAWCIFDVKPAQASIFALKWSARRYRKGRDGNYLTNMKR